MHAPPEMELTIYLDSPDITVSSLARRGTKPGWYVRFSTQAPVSWGTERLLTYLLRLAGLPRQLRYAGYLRWQSVHSCTAVSPLVFCMNPQCADACDPLLGSLGLETRPPLDRRSLCQAISQSLREEIGKRDEGLASSSSHNRKTVSFNSSLSIPVHLYFHLAMPISARYLAFAVSALRCRLESR